MNAPHLHLLLNHVPVLGTAFGFGLLAFGMWRKSSELQKAALGVFVFAALLAVPTYLTGEPAEDIVESLPGVAKVFIEQHENAASIALTGIVVLGVVALLGLFLFRRGRTVSASFATLMLVSAMAVSVLWHGPQTWADKFATPRFARARVRRPPTRNKTIHGGIPATRCMIS